MAFPESSYKLYVDIFRAHNRSGAFQFTQIKDSLDAAYSRLLLIVLHVEDAVRLVMDGPNAEKYIETYRSNDQGNRFKRLRLQHGIQDGGYRRICDEGN